MAIVQIVRRKNGLLLIEWQENELPKRAWVRADMAVNDNGSTAEVAEPGMGQPYGVDFWRLLQPSQVKPEDIDRELKRRGIWTVADLRANPNVALAAIQSVYGLNLQALLEAADKYDKELTEVLNGSASL